MFGDLGKEPKGINDDKVEIEEISTTNVERDRLIVVGVLAFFSIFLSNFEQAGASMNIFAVRDYTDRSLEGSGVTIFKILSALISLLPVIILTVLFF